MFVDRLEALLKQVGCRGRIEAIEDSIHHILDRIDRTVGISTRHGCASAYVIGAKPFPQSEYVGARLARLERHVGANKTPALFWLGAEGEAT